MDAELTQQHDYGMGASDRVSVNLESASIQTVAAFAEFLRYSRGEDDRGGGEGTRLRAASQPLVLQPRQRARRPASSAYAELPEAFQVDLAPSPSTRGRAERGEFSPSSPRPSASRPRSFSTTESDFPRLHPATFRVSSSTRESQFVLLSCLKTTTWNAI